MLLITYIQLSLFGKTSWERFLQMTGWTLEPSYPLSRTPKFQCLLREDGETPEWCEGERLMCAGGSWTPSIGQAPEGWHEGSGFSSWRILEADVPQTYYLSPVQCSHFLRLAERAGGCIRFLTETESERLMGLPEGWTKYGADGMEIRPLQRYKALGNAIALPCADYIMAGIYEVLADRVGKEE